MLKEEEEEEEEEEAARAAYRRVTVREEQPHLRNSLMILVASPSICTGW
jgi:hypothetical protein